MRKEKEFNQEKDYAIREAVGRQARKKPTMPSDLNQRVLARMNQPAHTLRHRNIWIAAACIAAAVILILTLWEDPLPNPSPSMWRVTNSQKSVNITQTSPNGDSNLSSNHITEEPITSPSPVKKQKVKPMSEKPVEEEPPILSQTPPKEEDIIMVDNTIDEQTDFSTPIEEMAESPSDPHALTPENMDRMIAQMAAYYQVRKRKFNYVDHDDISSGTMYIMPDDKNNDIIGQLSATLLRFDTSASDILFTYSAEMFYCRMKSEADGIMAEDIWIAERKDGKVYLYRTSSTEEQPFSPASYMTN